VEIKESLIYLLSDPRPDDRPQHIYVGVTNNLEQRVEQHLRCRGKTYVANWIKSLASLGLKPVVEALETGLKTQEQREFAEKDWIRNFRKGGFIVLNLTDGGEGVCGYVPTPEARAKNGAAHKGCILTPEHKAKIGRGLVNSPYHEEHMKKLHAARTGKPMAEEHRKRIALALTGKKFSEERRKALSVSHMGYRAPIETRMKMSEFHKEWARDPVHKARKSAYMRQEWARRKIIQDPVRVGG